MESIRLKNIKSFEDTGKIEIKPITVFVGKNSSGKSSLIRFPAVLAQTATADSDSPIKFYGKMVDFGNYEDVLHKDSTEKLSFELEYPVNVSVMVSHVMDRNMFIRSLLEENPVKVEPDIRNVTLKVSLDKAKKRIFVETVELYIEDKCLYHISKIENNTYCFYVNYKYTGGVFIERPYSVDISKVYFEKFIPCFEEHDAIKSIYSSISNGEKFDQEKFQKLMRIAYKEKHDGQEGLSEKEKVFIEMWDGLGYMAGLLRRVFSRFENESRNIRYIGPFRIEPDRYYRDPEYISSNVGVHGENTSNILIRESRRKDPKLLSQISRWTKDVLGYEVDLKDISNGMFQIMLKDSNGNETNMIDNGFGVSQVLPIVTEVMRLMFSKPRNLKLKAFDDLMVILEQPELHLHPAAQSELADLFVNGVINGNGKKKILIETHSEHLIRKLQILVANKECPLTKDMIKIYYVDKDENGNAHVDEMKLLDNGKFESPWPSGFFDRGYQLSRELAKAGAQ